MAEARIAETMIHLPAELPSDTVAINWVTKLVKNQESQESGTKSQEPRAKSQEPRARKNKAAISHNMKTIILYSRFLLFILIPGPLHSYII